MEENVKCIGEDNIIKQQSIAGFLMRIIKRSVMCQKV